MASITQPCIDPNPDIAGIGVRVSIYVQAFLTLLPAVLFILDGKITRYEFRTLHSINTSLLLTACALLVSAFVQAGTFGLSVYHANVVLNLSWINSISTIAYDVVDPSGPKGELEEDNDDGDYSWSAVCQSVFRASPTKLNWANILCVIHLCVVGAFGVWVWSNIETFGSQPQCTPQTFTTVFWHDIPVTNKPFRIFALVLYSILIIPLVNIFFIPLIGTLAGCILLLCFVLVNRGLAAMSLVSRDWIKEHKWEKQLKLGGLAAVGITDIILLANTELMIQRSRFNVKPGESQWTFGQTLAMLLIGLPLIDLGKQLVEWYQEDFSKASDKVEGEGKVTTDEQSGKDGDGGEGGGRQLIEADSSSAIFRQRTKWPSNATVNASAA